MIQTSSSTTTLGEMTEKTVPAKPASVAPPTEEPMPADPNEEEATTTAGPPIKSHRFADMFDVSFYNSTSKTSFRLAVCLEGIQCEEPGSPRCDLAFQKCNEGLNVTVLPFRVKQMLSECSVDDILCHLQRVKSVDKSHCEDTYMKCASIVIPSTFVPLVAVDEEAEDTQDIGVHDDSLNFIQVLNHL